MHDINLEQESDEIANDLANIVVSKKKKIYKMRRQHDSFSCVDYVYFYFD